MSIKDLRKKKNKHLSESNTIALTDETRDVIDVQIEAIATDLVPAPKEMVQITDSKILGQVDNLVSSALKIGNSTKRLADSVNDVKDGLYRVIVPSGAKLAKSREMPNAVRAFYHNKRGIAGHANLVKVSQQGAIVTGAIDAAMNVSSMIVGQYYMAQVNQQLDTIKSDILHIVGFQNNEYKSKVIALLEKIKLLSEFQSEVLENNQQRVSRLTHLDNLEQQCIELLGQANLMLFDCASNADIDFAAYEKQLVNAHNWQGYQKVLLDILYRISDLKYTYNLGCVSYEQCSALLDAYTKQCDDANSKLSQWHKSNIKRLNISISDMCRKRNGIDGVIHLLPSLFDKSYSFKPMSASTAQMIDEQMSQTGIIKTVMGNLYDDDVELIVNGSEVYYLPNNTIDNKR